MSQTAASVPENNGPASIILDPAVYQYFASTGMRVAEAVDYKTTRLGTTTKLTMLSPSGETEAFFLKTITMGPVGALMCEGEYESLKAIHDIAPSFAPEPITWGRMVDQDEKYFILERFCDMSLDIAGPEGLAVGLAEIHREFRSPIDKFGFHVTTCHGPIVQLVQEWEDTWATFFKRHLGQYMRLAAPLMDDTEYGALCKKTLDYVVPALLLPLQENGRVLKPCLIHGDCWDGNTASVRGTGQVVVFDPCSFYGHNEYDIGNWRAARHKVSDASYLNAYKQSFPASEPAEDWHARNVLYSLPFNLGNIINVPNSSQRKCVVQDMKWLCENHAAGKAVSEKE